MAGWSPPGNGTIFWNSVLASAAGRVGTDCRQPALMSGSPYCCVLCCAVLSHSVMSNSLRPHGLLLTRLLCPWTFSRQDNGVSCYTLLQRIFPAQGLNPGLLHCRWILDHLSHQGRPRILVWLAYPFSSGSSWPRNWTRASCIASGFFTIWATREAPMWLLSLPLWLLCSWAF